MKCLKFVTIMFLLSGCGSLRGSFYDKVHQGDSKAAVIEEFGQPDTFEANSLFELYRYKKSGDICNVVFVDEKVSQSKCEVDPDYESFGQRLGRGLSAGASGYAAKMKGESEAILNSGHSHQPENRPVNCTTHNTYYGSSTSCY